MSEQDPRVQLAVHSEQIKTLGKNVETIMTNHLPHIQDAVDKLERKLAYWAGAIAVVVVAAQFLIPKLIN